MSTRRTARTLLLALLTIGCGRPRADTHAPEAVAPEPASTPEVVTPGGDPPAAEEAAPSGEPSAPQSISFADDADPEPTTQVQAAPKRPPIPRFRLFGTRENDGPN